jgi:hypothetical protein
LENFIFGLRTVFLRSAVSTAFAVGVILVKIMANTSTSPTLSAFGSLTLASLVVILA